MKRAKVSAVYEGKGRKRDREEEREEEEEEEEEGNSSKKAREMAKARKNGSRANSKTPYGFPPSGRTIMTRSMGTLSNLGEQEMGKVVEVAAEVEKGRDINVVEAKPVGGVAEMLEEKLKELDWPPVLISYEEEYWLGGGMRWNPDWDLMTGDVWLGGEGVQANDWVVDVWGN